MYIQVRSHDFSSDYHWLWKEFRVVQYALIDKPSLKTTGEFGPIHVRNLAQKTMNIIVDNLVRVQRHPCA